MNRYYKPTEEEFIIDLECEVYDEEFNSWQSTTLDSNSLYAFLPLLKGGDIRVKYLDSRDFNVLGFIIKKEFIRQQDVIIDYDIQGKEITEKENIFNEEDLNILHNSIKVGIFKPHSPLNNVVMSGKKHTVKNLTELRKILK